MHQIVVTVFGVAGLLALVSLLPALARRLNLPYTVLLAAVGGLLGALVFAVRDVEAMGAAGDFLVALRGFDISAHAFLYIFLPTLLFEAALAVDVRRLLDDLAPILTLAVVAVLVCTLAVGFALSGAAGIDLRACLLLGAIVATTDPAAVVGVFRDIGAPRRLTVLVEGECLFNDAAAIAISTLLIAMLAGNQPFDATGTILAFLVGFLGGAAAGYVAARAACVLFVPLRGLRLAEITLTVSLAYLVFVVAEHYLQVSGVVAVVTAGLVLRSVGRTRITPSTWHSLMETWEQLGFWASSLIFLLAAMLMPRLLVEAGAADLLWLAVLVVAALAARAVVLYGLLPVLSATGLAERVSGAYKAVILWGGLRGAVSLALALAVTENMELAPEVRRAVAVLTTGFVLFTLLINGPTLRPLIRLLRLDRLSPADRAMRERALTLAIAGLNERIVAVAEREGIDVATARDVARDAARRVATVGEADEAALSDDDRVYIGLATLASREQELYLEAFRDRLTSRRIVDLATAAAGRLADGVKTDGRAGYEKAARAALGFSWGFRAALALHHRLGLAGWLAHQLADRFEMLLGSETAVRRLIEFNRDKIAALLGGPTALTLSAILEARLAAIEAALAALKLQYPDHARTLQSTYLARVSLRLEEESYRALLAESAISQEVFNDLSRRLSARWQVVDRRPPLDIAMKRVEMVARVPLFASLPAQRLAEIARLLKPRLVVPEERIIAAGEEGDAMYFIASGAVEVRVPPASVRLGSGEFFGEIALLTHRPRTADVAALGFCKLLVLHDRDLDRLLARDPELRRRLDEVARRRLGESAAADQPAAQRLSNTSLASPGA